MDSFILNNNRKGGSVKVTITPSQPKQLSHLPKRQPVDIGFSDLTYTVSEGRKKNGKQILKSVSGRLRSGELTAIMGPSGAGKSTLLNILTGYKTSGMNGSITINGQERNLSLFRKLSCYIMQDNQLHANLTVAEAMRVASNLKLGKDMSSKQKEEVVGEILDTLGLHEHRNTMTSSLSGGQKKRLSIALELVNNPPIMFFDEPTSGLDSSSCFQCISLLKSLAQGGRTIICTIHQPSARLFEMFDHLYTLAEGQCVYQGSTQQLVPFLSTLGLVCPSYHNPASFVIEVSCGEYGDNIKKCSKLNGNGILAGNEISNPGDGDVIKFIDSGVNLYQPYASKELKDESNGTADGMSRNVVIPVDLTASEKSPDNVTTALLDTGFIASPRHYPTSEITQFWIVLKRTLLFSRRDWTLMYLRLFAHILVGLLIGALYYDIGNDGAKVLSNLGFLFFNMLFLMYTSMTITILSFIKRTYNLMQQFNIQSYYLAITLSDIPFQAVFCVIYVSIVYFLTSQPPELFRFSMFLGACLLISFVAQSVGLVVGAAMNVQNGVFLAPVMSVPFLLFSGFFVSFDAIPIYVYCHFKSPMTTLEELDMVDADITLDIIALIVIFFVLRISAFVFLRWKLLSTR
ncbi:hypothetical protein L9F63_024286 [Diploptera punctata]|uniref:ABC transporter domain-containing protein n=1 Tax=Diploptera punctata TaxID=6984 RepID=A0AAD7ZH18_DIPPU|nr:hypothetical protein L9F63_024286 [Diploptera punctata]